MILMLGVFRPHFKEHCHATKQRQVVVTVFVMSLYLKLRAMGNGVNQWFSNLLKCGLLDPPAEFLGGQSMCISKQVRTTL